MEEFLGLTDRRKAVLVIMDGLGDRPLKELNGQTTLQAARTPVFDRLAKTGQNGLMDVIGPGITPGSDAAHLALFGYNPKVYYKGRGPLETLGSGLDSAPGDIAFRTNFATVDSNLVVTDRRAGREFTHEEQKALQEQIDGIEIDGVTVRFLATVEHRGALVLRGKGLSDKITDVDPHETGKHIAECKALSPDANETAKVVNKLVIEVYNRLKDLKVNKEREKRGLPPANIILLRGAGRHEEIPSLQEIFKIKAAVIAGGALYIGTGKYVGMEHVPAEGQTGTITTNFHNIAMKAVDCINSDYDYVFVHIKATDNASHDGNYKEKILAIEKTDEMVGEIVDAVGDKIVIVITGDHSTPIMEKEHACDPVPIILWANFMRQDSVDKFSEIDAGHGALNTIRGLDVMPMLLGYAGYIEKFGA